VDLSRPTTAGPGDIDWPTVSKDPRFTESREDLKQLYELAQYGQLNDAFMRELKKDQVIFLAAHDPAVASFELEMETTRGKLEVMLKGGPATSAYVREMTKLNDLAAQKNKLEQNARRARLDLYRRRDDETRQSNRANIRFAALIGVAGAIVGSIIGGIIGRW
jgi:hypothetical protein